MTVVVRRGPQTIGRLSKIDGISLSLSFRYVDAHTEVGLCRRASAETMGLLLVRLMICALLSRAIGQGLMLLQAKLMCKILWSCLKYISHESC